MPTVAVSSGASSGARLGRDDFFSQVTLARTVCDPEPVPARDDEDEDGDTVPEPTPLYQPARGPGEYGEPVAVVLPQLSGTEMYDVVYTSGVWVVRPPGGVPVAGKTVVLAPADAPEDAPAGPTIVLTAGPVTVLDLV